MKFKDTEKVSASALSCIVPFNPFMCYTKHDLPDV